MRNWLGQTLEVSNAVYRGARDGNASSFKVGVIKKIDSDKEKVTVEWLFEDTTYYRQGEWPDRVAVPRKAGWTDKPSIGHCHKDTIIRIDEATFSSVRRRFEIAQQAKHENWTAKELKEALNNMP